MGTEVHALTLAWLGSGLGLGFWFGLGLGSGLGLGPALPVATSTIDSCTGTRSSASMAVTLSARRCCRRTARGPFAELLDGGLVARGRPVLELGGQEAVALDVAQLELKPEIAAEHDEGARVVHVVEVVTGVGLAQALPAGGDERLGEGHALAQLAENEQGRAGEAAGHRLDHVADWAVSLSVARRGRPEPVAVVSA